MCCNTWTSRMDTTGSGKVILENSYREKECKPSAHSRMGTTIHILLKIAKISVAHMGIYLLFSPHLSSQWSFQSRYF